MAQATQPKGLTVKTDGPAPELFIYDEIGPSWWGLIGADVVIDALAELGDVADLIVRINSPGGDVFEAGAIYNALVRHKATVQVEIDALAASAATVIAMAGDQITIASNAMIMIHNAWSFAAGNAAELRAIADTLEQVDGTIVDTYVARTDQSADDVRQWMANETWMNADRAVELGFADAKGPLQTAQASVAKGRYKNTPQRFVDSTRTVRRDLMQMVRPAGRARPAIAASVPASQPSTPAIAASVPASQPSTLNSVQARINLARRRGRVA